MFPNLTNLSLLLATILLLLTLAKGEGKDFCCKEKMVGTTNYTLQPYNNHHLLPLACLDNCVYTVANTSTPKYCFEKGIFKCYSIGLINLSIIYDLFSSFCPLDVIVCPIGFHFKVICQPSAYLTKQVNRKAISEVVFSWEHYPY